MKAVLPILAGLALVACKGEPAHAGDTNATPAESAMSDAAAKAQTVSLNISGMT